MDVFNKPELPYDRFKRAALFLCGYFNYPENEIDHIASRIRDFANINEPYELCTCEKCKNQVELIFYKGDESECPIPHYTCPYSNCRAKYDDKQGKQRCKELEHHYEDIDERIQESFFDDMDEDW